MDHLESLIPDFEERWNLMQEDIVIPERPTTPPMPQLQPLPHSAGFFNPNPITQPSDSLLTRNQHYMLFEFQKAGRQGLGSAIYKIASEYAKLPSATNFGLLEDDQVNGTCYVLQLLRTLPDTIIESLIKCTLPYDYHNSDNVELRAFVDDEMKLMDTPGIQLNLPNFGIAKEGKCLSGRHMKSLLNSVELYFKNDPADNCENSEIDTFFTGEEEILDRRWGKSERSKIVAGEWIARVKEMYLQGLPDADLDEPFTRCLAECGWGLNMFMRAGGHTTNDNTTDLFALYNVLTRKLGFPAPLKLTLFPIWTKKVDLCRVAEILGHILCSTYCFEGGLNLDWAGDFGPERIAASTFMYDVNGKKISERVESIKLLNQDHDEAKLDKIKNVQKYIEEEKASHQEYIDAREKYEEARTEALEAQSVQKEMMEAVNELREWNIQRERLIDQHRSQQTSPRDLLDSLLRRAENLLRNRQVEDDDQHTSTGEAPPTGD